MNKKIFAALASATMALSATGSLAVFAEDFDVVTEADGNNGGVTGVVVPNSKVKLNTDNFPDYELIQSIINSQSVNGLSGLVYNGDIDTSKVKYLGINEDTKDLKGIELFGNLEAVGTGTVSVTSGKPTFTANLDHNALVTADLSKNGKLTTISLTEAPDLQTLLVPAGKTLNTVIVSGVADEKAPITTLDLSQNKWLKNVTVNYTDIAKIDLSGNGYLSYANLQSNDLNTVDFTKCYSLETANVSDNELYGIELPDSPDLISLTVSNNLLQELNVSDLAKLHTLVANDNELRTIDLSNNKDLQVLRVENNHLGAFSTPDTFAPASWGTAAGQSLLSPQIIYVGAEFNAVNLKDSFEDFDSSNYVKTMSNNVELDTKTGVLKLLGSNPNYVYNANYNANEGKVVQFRVSVVKADVLNRLYNPNSGEHFYTADNEEKDALVKLGWQDEGIGWVSPTESSTPVYRLYNPNAGDHHYTTNSFERDTLVSVGWKNEGIGWYSYNEDRKPIAVQGKNIKAVKVLREYNPNAKAAGAHNYTINHAENDFLVSVGWLDEGIAWYSMK